MDSKPPPAGTALRARLCLYSSGCLRLELVECFGEQRLRLERYNGTRIPPDIQARDWLNLEPDSAMINEYYALR